MTTLLRGFGRRSDAAELSVVVPAFNVAHSIDSTLDSILAQPVDGAGLQVVVVDDGSADRTAAVVGRRARQDRRIRLVRQDNRGVGGARNTGVRHATGRHLTFCDADDQVPADTYPRMLDTLQRTGSDLVIGKLVREIDGRRSAGPWTQVNHRRDQLGVQVRDHPSLLADVWAVNKVFRRDFWQREQLGFPERLRYEDQPALTRALLAARQVDVLSQEVYVWGARSDGSSITQNRHTVADLRDRFASKQMSTRLVEALGDPRIREIWYRGILAVDMWEYFRAATRADDLYWDTLTRGLHSLWNPTTWSFYETQVPFRQRTMGWLVEQGRRQDLREFVDFLDRPTTR